MAGPYYQQQPGHYPPGHNQQRGNPRGMPPRKKKSNDAVVWTVAIVVSLVCVVGAILLIINRPQGDASQNAGARVSADVALGHLLAGMFNAQTVTSAEFFPHLDQTTREAIEAAKGVMAPKRNEKVTEATSLEGYITRLGQQRHVMAGHPTLTKWEAEYRALLEKLKAKDDPKLLREAVLEVPEVKAKYALIIHKGVCDDQRTRERHRALIDTWRQNIDKDSTSRTNRQLGEAKNKLTEDKNSPEYKRLQLVDALHLFTSNMDQYATLDSLMADRDTRVTYDLIKDHFPKWSEEILADYNRDTAAWVKDLIDTATGRYQEAANLWEAERTRVNTDVDNFVRRKTAMVQAVEAMLARANLLDAPGVKDRLDKEKQEISRVQVMRYGG